MIEDDIKKWWKNYKIIHFKPRMDCTLKELEKKYKTTKNLIYSFLLTTFLFLGIVMELWITEGKVSIMLNTLLLMSVLAFWNEITEGNNLQLFIHLKRKGNLVLCDRCNKKRNDEKW